MKRTRDPSDSRPFRVLAVDPGRNATGIALFMVAFGSDPESNAVLCSCELLRFDPWELGTVSTATAGGLFVRDNCMTVIVVESQEVYAPGRGGRSTTPNANSLIVTAQVAGGWAAWWARLLRPLHPVNVQFIAPKHWKGEVPKEVHNQRTLRSLTHREQELLASCEAPASKLHNVVDAIALGQWGVKTELEYRCGR